MQPNKTLITFLFFFSFFSLTAQLSNQAIEAINYATEGKGSFKGSKVAAHDISISNDILDEKRGIRHVYLQQTLNGINIKNAISGVFFDRNGNIFHHNNGFIQNRSLAVPNAKVSREQAIRNTADHFGINLTRTTSLIESSNENNQRSTFDNPDLSREKINVFLQYIEKGKTLHLCWSVGFKKKDGYLWNVHIDTQTGEVVDQDTYTVECAPRDLSNIDKCEDHSTHAHTIKKYSPSLMANSYNVWPLPGESPNHVMRTIVTEPWNAAPNASPFGWHDTNGAVGAEFTITRGNNVFAYEDRDGDQIPGFSPDGGATLNFDFPVDLQVEAPVDYQDVATTNLFYWNNIVHDVLYQYGFDEVSGNFQANNYGNGGAAGDAVNAEAQSGADVGASDNAFFGTPPDGGAPTMMMFEFTSTNPRRDSDLDAGIIAHEYGHGLSNRLTAGPAAAGCLSNTEQMGEGWSDYLGAILTIEEGDTGVDRRGMGTYVLGQTITGRGIRAFPYSTDFAINPQTYDDIMTASVPHGVGSIWATMLWDMTWLLIDKYGFDSDIYNGTGGNNIAFQLVVEGLKLQPCSPGFVDGRDAILAADQALYGGANQCDIWQAFSNRGLGFSAQQGSSASRSDGVESFDLPPSCLDTVVIQKSVIGSINLGDTLEYSIDVFNFSSNDISNVNVTDVLRPRLSFVPGSITCGGSFQAGSIVIDEASLGAFDTLECSFKVVVRGEDFSEVYFEDDLESGTTNWIQDNDAGSNSWELSNLMPNSGAASWFSPNSMSENNTQSIILNPSIRTNTILSFWHSYNTEPDWDGGYVEISTDGGSSWTDLGPFIMMNGYDGALGAGSNNTIAGRQAFNGDSEGYINTTIDLSNFNVSNNAQIRFTFGQDNNTFGTGPNPGWFIDDVSLIGGVVITNTACLTYDGATEVCDEVSTFIFECQDNCFSCTDGILNGNEVGIDCGGDACTPCPCTTNFLSFEDETIEDKTFERSKTRIDINPDVGTLPDTRIYLQARNAINVFGEFTVRESSLLRIIMDDCTLQNASPVEEK